jgi:tRNA(Met) C34 N-acetyltransferase TmcA
MDAIFWYDMAMLITARRREGKAFALGNAFGVARARREDAAFVTADREANSKAFAPLARHASSLSAKTGISKNPWVRAEGG